LAQRIQKRRTRQELGFTWLKAGRDVKFLPAFASLYIAQHVLSQLPGSDSNGTYNPKMREALTLLKRKMRSKDLLMVGYHMNYYSHLNQELRTSFTPFKSSGYKDDLIGQGFWMWKKR
jgi:hypothetical protein